MSKKFVWLRGDEVPRKGPPLEHGKVYAFSDFPPGVAEWWITTGAATEAETKPKKEKE